VVMTPSFFGAEPTAVDTGKHAGTRVFAREERLGLEFARSLSPRQREMAVGDVGQQRMDGRIQTAAFRDNVVLAPAGLPAGELAPTQRRDLLDLVQVYTGRQQDAHARIRLEEIQQHLDETRFVWVGGFQDDSVFYYRIQSPVVSIEFDHLSGIAFDNDEPSRNHIHTVVRSPNGNDYGKDLLRQHRAKHHASATAVI
jgi:uncharacterized protein DUF3500